MSYYYTNEIKEFNKFSIKNNLTLNNFLEVISNASNSAGYRKYAEALKKLKL